ncbi:MAG TPA: HPF/RaiA family ribosome-associated protein [Nitrospira sp.]|nr:HPF/RaiA family ribosome-associated protein [Nitrospira sp.]
MAMQILVNTDNHIQGSEALTRHTESVIRHVLGRFERQITRVEVFFTDEDSRQRSTERDKRCLIEVHVAGLKPIAAGERGATVEQALDAAADTMQSNLDRTIGRLHDAKIRRPDKAA